jgi:small conductance mechanosensitive channel
MEKYLEQANDLLIHYLPWLIGAILVLIIGLWIINILSNWANKIMRKRNVDDSLRPFIKSLISIVLKVALIIAVMSMIGIEMTSFIAILGAAGLAIGMALGGTLQNFAGGVLILIFKPFRIGDFIEAQGYTGTVKEISIFSTVLNTPDNKIIIIPNGGLSTSSLVNYSKEPTRRVDWTFGIGYGDDTDKAKTVLKGLLESDTRILKDPEMFIAVSELADSSVNFVVRAWVNAEDYWGVFFDMNEKVYKTFDKEGLNIPFPQMDLHLQKEN